MIMKIMRMITMMIMMRRMRVKMAVLMPIPSIVVAPRILDHWPLPPVLLNLHVEELLYDDKHLFKK